MTRRGAAIGAPGAPDAGRHLKAKGSYAWSIVKAKTIQANDSLPCLESRQWFQPKLLCEFKSSKM